MLDAKVLLKAAAGIDEATLIVDDRKPMTTQGFARFTAMIERRASHEPVAYIVGVKEFWSLPIAVRAGVLIPRADSETLVAAVLRRREVDASRRVLDLGCGSGALLCALLASMPNAAGVGVDINADAVALTAENLRNLDLASRGEAVRGDWTEGLEGRFDIIVSNPPYIADGDREALPPDVRLFEDPGALFGGADGVGAYRALARQTPQVAAGGALIVLELGVGQAGPVRALFQDVFPSATLETASDLAGIDRALIIDLASGPG
jgi:release factor glutamine methyltransferase